MAKDTTGSRAGTDSAGYLQGSKSAPSDETNLPSWGEHQHPFILSHGAASWELAETPKGWCLLPVLSRLVLRPGVNWSKGNRAGVVSDSSDIEAKARSRLKQKVLPNWEEYRSDYPGRGKTRGYFLDFERIRVYDDGSYEVAFDQAAYDEFRASLVTKGIIDPPRESVISTIRSRLKKAVSRASRQPHLPMAQDAKAEAERRLVGLDAAVKAIGNAKTLTGAKSASVEE